MFSFYDRHTNRLLNSLYRILKSDLQGRDTQSLRCLYSLKWLINVRPFKEPEGSLPCSQQPAIGPFPEPDETSPHSHTPFPYDQFNSDNSFQLHLFQFFWPLKMALLEWKQTEWGILCFQPRWFLRASRSFLLGTVLSQLTFRQMVI
jgi:hypothetical protein